MADRLDKTGGTSLADMLYTAVIAASFLIAVFVIGRAIPVTHTVTRRVVDMRIAPSERIIYKDRIVTKEVVRVAYKDMPNWMKPVDPDKVCGGSLPVQIIAMDVTQPNEEARSTWVKAEVVGRGIYVTCAVAGNMDRFWHKGDIIQIKQGTAW